MAVNVFEHIRDDRRALAWTQEHLNPDGLLLLTVPALPWLYSNDMRDTGIISEHVVVETGQLFDFYFMAIQKGLLEQVIKPYPVELVGEMLYRVIIAVMNLIIMQSDPIKQEEYIRSGFEIFWNGIRA